MFSHHLFLLAMAVTMGCHFTYATNCEVTDAGGLGNTCHCVSQQELLCSCGRNVRVEPDDWRLMGKESLVIATFENCALPNITAEYFERYIKLQSLVMTNAQIETIDEDAFSNTANLQFFEITESVKTSLNEIPYLPNQVKRIDIINTNISVLDPSLLPTNLHVLMLDKNPISHIPSQFKDRFTSFIEFRCSECVFTEVPINLPSTVEWLVLPGNHIRNITEESPLPPMTGLMHLNLNFNRLVHIWEKAFQNIHTRPDNSGKVLLLLHGNQLTYLSDKLLNDLYQHEVTNVSAINVDLGANPLDCNCSWTWLLDQQPFRKTLSMAGLCYQPEFLRGRNLVDLTYDDFKKQDCPNLVDDDSKNRVFMIVAIVLGTLILMAVIVIFISLGRNYYRKQQTTSDSNVVNIEAQERGL